MKTTKDSTASIFFSIIMTNINEGIWNSTYESLRSIFKDKFIVKDETTAKLYLGLALMALELESCKNKFSEEASNILYKSLLHILEKNEKLTTKEIEQIKMKLSLYRQYATNVQRNPYAPIFEELSSDLLKEWLGENISHHYIEFGKNKVKILNPATVSIVGSILIKIISVLNNELDFWNKISKLDINIKTKKNI